MAHLPIAAGGHVAGGGDDPQVDALIHAQLPQSGGQADLLDEVRQGFHTSGGNFLIGLAGGVDAPDTDGKTLELCKAVLVDSRPGAELPAPRRGCSRCRPPTDAPSGGTGSRPFCPA